MTVRALILAFTTGFLCPPLAFAQEADVATKPMAGKQVEKSFTTTDSATVDYLLYLPTDYDEKEKLPLMLFLHGRGESNGPLSLVAKWGPPRMVARGDELPYIIVSPQCPKSDQWGSPTQQKRLIELLDFVVGERKVDEDRIYLTGLSLGGYGSWRLAADHPNRFAAVVPVCGGARPEDAEALKNMPIWAFHGDKDFIVPIKLTSRIVDAIREAGGTSIRFTTLEEVGHASWTAAYALPDLYRWLNKQRRSAK